MIVWLIVWKWVNSKLLKVKWEGIKGLSQNFIFHSWSPWIQILFTTKPWREDDMTSSIFSKMKKGVENIWISFEIFPILKLYATQWFSREKIKWLLQKHMKYELGVSKVKFKVLLEIIFNLELFGFYSNYFSPKIKYMENRVKWFPTI